MRAYLSQTVTCLGGVRAHLGHDSNHGTHRPLVAIPLRNLVRIVQPLADVVKMGVDLLHPMSGAEI